MWPGADAIPFNTIIFGHISVHQYVAHKSAERSNQSSDQRPSSKLDFIQVRKPQMKRKINLASTLFFLASLTACQPGCKNDAEQAKDDSVDLLEQVQDSPPNSDSRTLSAGQTTETKLLDGEFAKQVAELSQKANSFEQQFDFAKAAAACQELHQVVVEQHGEQSWQATNVRLAVQTNRMQSQFDATQLNSLKEIGELQRVSEEAFLERDFGKSYNACKRGEQLTLALFGKSSFLYGRKLRDLGKLASNNRQLDLALNYYSAALDTLKMEMGDLHPDIEELTFTIGQIYQAKAASSGGGSNELQQAIRYFAESVRLTALLWGEEDNTHASRCHDLGVACHQSRDFENAKKFIFKSAVIRREKLGATHPQLAHSLRNLAVVHQDQGDLESARDKYKEAIEIYIARLGQENGFTVDSQTKLATVLTMLKQYDEAEQVLAIIANVQKTALGSNHEVYAETLFKLATVMLFQEKYAAAEPLYDHALKVQRSKLGLNNPKTQKTTKAFASLLKKTNRTAMAEQLMSNIQQTSFEQPQK